MTLQPVAWASSQQRAKKQKKAKRQLRPGDADEMVKDLCCSGLRLMIQSCISRMLLGVMSRHLLSRLGAKVFDRIKERTPQRQKQNELVPLLYQRCTRRNFRRMKATFLHSQWPFDVTDFAV
jgi:hypothetical protein